MKIFGTKKKTQAALASSKSSHELAIEELLKKDPSTWNAKQRRMIKRFQEQQPQKELQTTEHATLQQQVQVQEDGTKETQDDSEEENSNQVEAEKGECDDGRRKDDGRQNSQETTEDHGDSAIATEIGPGIGDSSEQKTKIDAKLQKLLDQLNSKQRRKLVRQIERDGDVEAVYSEVTQLLGGNAEVGENKRQHEELSSDKSPTDGDLEPSKKKRRKGADWSALPPEERLRREEQRRLQKEAAARRESGEVEQHRHPLNSERRRANRRKPKWQKPSANGRTQTNEHAVTGYKVRVSK